jgi:vitamin B12 transporter
VKGFRMVSSQLLAVVGLIAIVPITVEAQEPADTARIHDIVITADRTPSPQARVSSATTVILGSELRERGIHFIADALRSAPGASVVSTGSTGGVTSLFLRGGESDYVRVLVDGVALNQDGGFYDFSGLTTDNVERIEIVRGPTSVLYGSDAMTGVVQIFTRAGTGKLRGEASFRAGTFGSWEGDAGFSGGTDGARFSAGISRFATDGIYPFNGDYRNTAASAGVHLVPDDRTRVRLNLRTGDGQLNLPTDFSGAVVDSNAFGVRRTVTAGLDLARVLSHELTLNVFLSSHVENEDQDNRPDSPGDSTGFFQSLSQGTFQRRAAEARVMLERSTVRVALGTIAEFEDLRESSQSLFNFGSGITPSSSEFAASRRNLGLYGQVITDLTSRTLLNLGARLDDNEGFGTHLTFRVGAVQQLRPGTRIRGSLGTGFKEPSLRENFAVSGFERGNPDLEPEQSRSWELGVEHAIVEDRVLISATYFDQRFQDLIQYRSPVLPTDTTYFNVAKATSRGFEAAVNLRPITDLHFAFSYTRLTTRVDDSGFDTQPGDVFLEGERLLRRPTHTLQADARYHFARRATLGVSLNYVGDRDDVDFRPFPSVRTTLPSYTLLNLDGSVALPLGSNGFEVSPTIRIENALDEEYDTVVGFPARGRTVLAGARVNF